VLAIEPCCLNSAQEKLGSVGVGTSVGHGENARSGVLQGEVLVRKLLAIDGFSTSAVVVGEVTSLAHEIVDNTVEGGALVAVTLLSSAKSTEVLSSLGGDIGAERHLNPSKRGAIGGHIEITYWVCHCEGMGVQIRMKL